MGCIKGLKIKKLASRKIGDPVGGDVDFLASPDAESINPLINRAAFFCHVNPESRALNIHRHPNYPNRLLRPNLGGKSS